VDARAIVFFVLCFGGVPAIIALWWWKRQREVVKARQWPQTEGTIESGAIEILAYADAWIELPTFGFSYKVAGEYYFGRFSLMPYREPREFLLVRMAGRRLRIHYDPARQEIWFIPDELIEECKVQKKMGPHFVGLYPK